MIWIFSDIYHPAVSGVPVTIEHLCQLLTDAGYPVGLVTVGSEGQADRLAQHHIFLRTQENVTFDGDQLARFSAVALSRRIPAGRDDVFVIATPGRIGLTGLGLARRRRRPSILLHLTDSLRYAMYYPAAKAVAYALPKALFLLGCALPSRRQKPTPRTRPSSADASFSPVLTAAVRFVYGFADVVVVLSEKSRQDLLRVGIRSEYLVTIPSGVPVPSKWRRKIRKANADVPRLLRLLYVGRLAPEKNIDLLLDTLKVLLCESHTPAQLTLVGDGRDTERLRRRVASLELTDSVVFLGAVPRHELAKIYSDADLFVFPSTTDTQALAVFEAGWFGLPILVVDPQHPWLAAIGDDASLADAQPAALAARIVDLHRRPGALSGLAAGAGRAAAATEARAMTGWLELLAALTCRSA